MLSVQIPPSSTLYPLLLGTWSVFPSGTRDYKQRGARSNAMARSKTHGLECFAAASQPNIFSKRGFVKKGGGEAKREKVELTRIPRFLFRREIKSNKTVATVKGRKCKPHSSELKSVPRNESERVLGIVTQVRKSRKG